jgi:hypothetical protein
LSDAFPPISTDLSDVNPHPIAIKAIISPNGSEIEFTLLVKDIGSQGIAGQIGLEVVGVVNHGAQESSQAQMIEPPEAEEDTQATAQDEAGRSEDQTEKEEGETCDTTQQARRDLELLSSPADRWKRVLEGIEAFRDVASTIAEVRHYTISITILDRNY